MVAESITRASTPPHRTPVPGDYTHGNGYDPDLEFGSDAAQNGPDPYDHRQNTEHPIVDSKIETERPPATSGHADPRGDAGGRRKAPGWGSTSVVALLLANLVPLVGVLGFGWDLGAIMLLFWAESGVIGFYAIMRLCYVAGWSALFLGPFFVVHFGGFMVGHLIFIYTLFLQGVNADGTVAAGTDAGFTGTLTDVFVPIFPALLALFLSHGVSFVTNFLRRREYAGRDPADQMKEPYRRIVVMHITIIFGGWLILALGAPAWALVLLVGLKTGVDLAAHRREHGETTGR